MSEMLGNRYFIAREYQKAAEQLEKALKETADPHKLKKKLIICYIETGQIEKALRLFSSIISVDPTIIIDTDPYHEDCPCPELVMGWEKTSDEEKMSAEDLESLGMLYLYCDIAKSLHYFKKALPKAKNKTIISSIIKQISSLQTA